VKYQVCIFCDACFGVHSLDTQVTTADGAGDLVSVASIADALPPASVDRLRAMEVTCPATGRVISQKKTEHLYLISVSPALAVH
jgi:hypothetical protein